MSIRVLIALLIFSSLFVYLEWSGGNQSFLWQAEYDVLKKAIDHPGEILHPFIIIPFLGQCLLILAIVRREKSKYLIYTGTGALSFLIIFIAIIGTLSGNIKIILSTLPFLLIAIYTIRKIRQPNAQ